MENSKIQESLSADETEIDLMIVLCDLWKGLKKYWWLYLTICCLCSAGWFTARALTYHPMYESRTSFTVSTSGNSMDTAGTYSFIYNAATASQLEKLFPYIIGSDVFQDLVKEDLNVKGPLPGEISSVCLPDSNLVTMTVRSSDPADAERILKSAMVYFPQVSRYVIGETRLNTIEPPVWPDKPANEFAYYRYMAEGFLAGLIVSFVLLVIYAITRRTVRTEDNIRDLLGQRSLGMVPQVVFRRRRKKTEDCAVWICNDRAGSGFSESIRSIALKTERMMKNNGWHVLLVTSTAPGEGKSTVAWNVAEALAERDRKVLLIDGDLRNPSLRERMVQRESGQAAGLDAVLRGKAGGGEAIGRMEPNGLFVLAGSNVVDMPQVLLDSPEMKAFLEEQKKEMDYIIIDTPPCGVLSDAAILAEYGDGVLYVIRQDTVHVWSILDAIQGLSGHNIPVIGCVLNGVQNYISGYGYGQYGRYGYGRYGYGRYGYGKYGYGRYGYGRYGYGQKKDRREERT